MEAYERARQHLIGLGYLVYAPGQHTGRCEAAYVVLRKGSTSRMIESRHVGYDLLDVNCYVPLDQYAELAAMVRGVKGHMRALRAQLRPTGYETPDVIEDQYRAHSRSIEYQVYRMLQGG